MTIEALARDRLEEALKHLLAQQRPPQDLRQLLGRAIAAAVDGGMRAAIMELEADIATYRKLGV
jgi:hypothetical protein